MSTAENGLLALNDSKNTTHFFRQLKVFVKQNKCIPQVRIEKWIANLALVIDMTLHVLPANRFQKGNNKFVTIYAAQCHFEYKAYCLENIAC